MSQSKNSVSGQLKFAACTISIMLPLAASSLHAGRFGIGLGETLIDMVAMGLLSASIIYSSVIVGLLAGKCAAQGRTAAALAGFAVWCCIATFSMSTSTLAILNTSGEKIQNQIADSSQNQAIQEMIQSNLAAMASLQETIDKKDPVRWASQRAKLTQEKAKLSAMNASLLSRQRSNSARGDGSAVAQSFIQLERFGISRTTLAALASFLLDAIPFVTAFSLGSLSGRRRTVEATTGKKNGRRLHAVA